MSIDATKVKQIRKHLKMSQADFGQCIGISSKSLHQLECGEFDPKLNTLEKIAKLGELSVAELVGEKGTLMSNPVFNTEMQEAGGTVSGVHIHMKSDDKLFQQILDAKDQLLEEKDRLLVQKDEVIALLKKDSLRENLRL